MYIPSTEISSCTLCPSSVSITGGKFSIIFGGLRSISVLSLMSRMVNSAELSIFPCSFSATQVQVPESLSSISHTSSVAVLPSQNGIILDDLYNNQVSYYSRLLSKIITETGPCKGKGDRGARSNASFIFHQILITPEKQKIKKKLN